MGTDGEHLYYDSPFIEGCSNTDLQTIICHEVLHAALSHVWRRGEREPIRWNIACVKPDEFILGSDKPISSYSIGDEIINGDMIGVVKQTFSRDYSGEMVNLKASNLLPFEVTPEHPVLAIKGKLAARYAYIRNTTSKTPKWVQAKDLSVGDYLLVPKFSNSCSLSRTRYKISLRKFVKDYTDEIGRNYRKGSNRTILRQLPLNEDTMWLMGLYLADGSKGNRAYDTLGFSLNAKKDKQVAEKAKAIVEELGYRCRVREKDNRLDVSFSSRILAKAFASWFGEGSLNKTIPNFILMNKDLKLVKAFINGYVDGDGYRRDNSVSCATISKKIALKLQLLLARFSILPSVAVAKQVRDWNGHVLEHPSTNWHKQYFIEWKEPYKSSLRDLNPTAKRITSTNTQWKDIGNFIATPIKAIERINYEGEVCNVATSNDTYLLSNVVVHNCDAVVNFHLEQQGFNLPDGVIKIPEAANLSTEEMYLKIKNVESIVGKVIDDHGSWGKPIGKGKAGGESKDKGDSSDGSSKEMTDIATQLAAAEREAKALEEKWKQLTAQARQIEKSQGRGMGSLEELIDDLIEPRLSWKEILRNMITSAVKNDYRIIPPNKKHLWRGIYLPSIYGEEIEIGYAVDTSGSMSTGEVKEGLSELKGICDSFQGYKIHIWQCDDGIQQYAELTPYNFDFPKKIRGRGGTSFCPVFEDIDKKGIRLGCLVYFTDGWGTIPTTRPYYPVVWLISNEGITKDSSYWQDLEKIGQIIEYKRQVK